jgi:hypothetical protein
VDFLGSDDFTASDKAEAARAVNEALAAGWAGMPISERFSLEEIVAAHERIEAPRQRGRVVVMPQPHRRDFQSGPAALTALDVSHDSLSVTGRHPPAFLDHNRAPGCD